MTWSVGTRDARNSGRVASGVCQTCKGRELPSSLHPKLQEAPQAGPGRSSNGDLVTEHVDNPGTCARKRRTTSAAPRRGSSRSTRSPYARADPKTWLGPAFPDPQGVVSAPRRNARGRASLESWGHGNASASSPDRRSFPSSHCEGTSHCCSIALSTPVAPRGARNQEGRGRLGVSDLRGRWPGGNATAHRHQPWVGAGYTCHGRPSPCGHPRERACVRLGADAAASRDRVRALLQSPLPHRELGSSDSHPTLKQVRWHLCGNNVNLGLRSRRDGLGPAPRLRIAAACSSGCVCLPALGAGAGTDGVACRS